MKRIAAAALAIFICLSFSSCTTSGPAPSKDSYTIAMVLPSGNDAYVTDMVAQAKKQAEETMADNEKINIIISEAKTASEQIAAMGKLIDENTLDLMIICPIDAEAEKNAVNSILAAGVKVIVYDKLIDSLKGPVNMTPDREGIAKATANYITNYFGSDETVNYLFVASDALSISTAMKKTMDDSLGGIERYKQLGDTLYGNYTADGAKAIVAAWLKTAPKEDIESLKLIITQYDVMATGILKALEEYKGTATLDVKLVTSIGATKDAIKAYADTTLETKFFTMYYSPSMVRETIKLAVSDLTGSGYSEKTKDGVYLVPSFSVSNADNADMTFEDYVSSGYYVERYPTEEKK